VLGSSALARDLVAAPDPSATPDVVTAPAGVMANFITAGTLDPREKVPALNAIAGAGVATLAVALPLAVLRHGTIYTYVMSTQNVTFKGTCTDSYTLTRGTVVLDHQTIHTYACAPGEAWEWATNGRRVPNSPGLAVLTGIVTFGKTRVTTTTKILIE
jgi:hypothetical protein